ncbi:hypothetical protein PNEG_01472 [Pneumocystis murina B123]|uniref:Complex 1 LYR protein domain-containing protein n=1 Tax=Pneumocystis murina (strain B123) TaxID=1069680 RepID=M7PIB1_PNEMU|nr:hypothetical protein PNEG_01472 [Pneumocystis murina B123]EMR10199.1 hypothetical protein PNEG_01472 [Pneumocystis murina B123]
MVRDQIISLYRSLLRNAKGLENYGFREYAIRRTKDAFQQHKNESDKQKIEELLQKGLRELRVLRRQSLIHYMYPSEQLIIETKSEGKKIRNINSEDVKKNG